jgi:hypothetical protein
VLLTWISRCLLPCSSGKTLTHRYRLAVNICSDGKHIDCLSTSILGPGDVRCISPGLLVRTQCRDKIDSQHGFLIRNPRLRLRGRTTTGEGGVRGIGRMRCPEILTAAMAGKSWHKSKGCDPVADVSGLVDKELIMKTQSTTGQIDFTLNEFHQTFRSQTIGTTVPNNYFLTLSELRRTHSSDHTGATCKGVPGTVFGSLDLQQSQTPMNHRGN